MCFQVHHKNVSLFGVLKSNKPLFFKDENQFQGSDLYPMKEHGIHCRIVFPYLFFITWGKEAGA